MNTLAGKFMRASVIYALLGMSLGILMAASHNHQMMPVHAHLNLVGWASMAIFALFYQIVPKAASTVLATIHFWIANVGLLILAPSIGLIISGVSAGEIGAVVGALFTLGSMLIFISIVFRTATAGHTP